MKKKYLILIIFFTISSNGQIIESKYLSEVKKTLTEKISSLKSLNSNQKSICLNKVFESLKTDKRIINKSPYFDIDLEVKKDNRIIEVKYTYNFGTNASLTSKFIIINEDKEIVVNYNFLKNYPKKYMTINDVNNKENIIARKILINKIIKLIGQEYFNFMMNSSFQKQKIENNFYIEEHTKIYNNWNKSVLIIFDIKNEIFYIAVMNEDKIIKFSEVNEFPASILKIINNWKPLE